METHGRKRIKGIIIAAAAAGLVVIVAAMFVIVRYTPTKEKMSGYKYFDIDKNTDKVLVMIDGESYPDTGINIDGRLYLPQEFIADNINVGFIMIRSLMQRCIQTLHISMHLRRIRMIIQMIQVRFIRWIIVLSVMLTGSALLRGITLQNALTVNTSMLQNRTD